MPCRFALFKFFVAPHDNFPAISRAAHPAASDGLQASGHAPSPHTLSVQSPVTQVHRALAAVQPILQRPGSDQQRLRSISLARFWSCDMQPARRRVPCRRRCTVCNFSPGLLYRDTSQMYQLASAAPLRPLVTAKHACDTPLPLPRHPPSFICERMLLDCVDVVAISR